MAQVQIPPTSPTSARRAQLPANLEVQPGYQSNGQSTDQSTASTIVESRPGIVEEHFGETDVIRFTDENVSPNDVDDFRNLINQPNFAVFRERHLQRLREQLSALDVTIRTQDVERDTLQKEEENNADWMWDIQSNFARLEQQMSELDSKRLELKSTIILADDDCAVAEHKAKKEENYLQNLKLNETKNQLAIQRLNEFYLSYYQQKEQAFMDAKIVDSGITRQKKELGLLKLQKRHLDFEVYRLQKQIIAGEERMELRDAIKKQRLCDLQNLKTKKMESESELEILANQSVQIFRSLAADMRNLEEKNDAAAQLSTELRNSVDEYKGIVAETNGYKKNIRDLQARHDQLTHMTMRCMRDLLVYEEKLEQYQQDVDVLYDQFGASNRLAINLSEKADAIQKHQDHKQHELQDARDILSKEIKKKQDADVAFHEALMENKSFLKAVRFSLSEYEKLNEKLHQIEEVVGQQDHEITQQAIFRIEATNELQTQTIELEKLAKEVKEKEKQLKEAVTTVERESAAIDRRQDKINRLTAKFDALLAMAGGDEISPIEAQLAALQAAIQEGEELFRDLKNDWLRYQTSIVRLTENRDQLHAKATDLDNQAFIATYKLNRLNKETAQIESECEEYIKTDKLIQDNIARASEQLFKFNGKEQELVMKALDMEHSSLSNLRNEEILLEEDKAELEKSVEGLKDVEEQIYSTKECTLMWERKLDLKKQAKIAIEKDFSQDHLENLRNEVHKLQLDKQTLEKEQLKVTHEMLFAAERRDQLHTQARRRVVEGEGPSLKKMEQSLDRKRKDIVALQKELKAVQVVEEDYRKRLELLQNVAEKQTHIVDKLETSWKKIVEEKAQALKERFQIRLENFIAQQYGKNYLSLKDGKFASKRLKTKNSAELIQATALLKNKSEDLEKIISLIGEQHIEIYEEKKIIWHHQGASPIYKD